MIKKHVLLDIELIKGTPTELNNLLISQKLDISPISSIEYARHHDSLVLFPDFTVSSDGEVKSILLISRYPIEKLSGKKVAMSSTSATSQVLLKLILKHAYRVEPDFFVSQPDVHTMLTEADAALLIGDIALKYSLDSEGFYLYDLGAEWKQLTGKKMVYAVWAVNRTFAETQSELCEYIFDLFKKSMSYSMKHFSEIACYAAKWEPFSSSMLEKYFRSLRFDFGTDYQEGLLQFYEMAADLGELESIPKLAFVNITSGAIV